MKLLALIALLGIPVVLHAQTESFDIVTYQPPAGWKKQVTDYAVSFSKIDQLTGTWCQLAIYKSVANSGVAAQDFSAEWKALVKAETYAGSAEPAPVTYTADGWTRSSGTSSFKWQGKDAQVSVLNISGYGTMVSAIVSMNSTKYAAEVDALLRSIQLKKPWQPQQQATQVVPATQAATQPATTAATITVTDTRGPQGIATATTNFDDGWTAQPFADYVNVTKNGTLVRLHYAVAIDDEMRRAANMAEIMWSKLVMARYRAAALTAYRNEMYTYNNVWFVSGDATELATGKKCYVALRVLVANGIATCIEIVSPSAAAFQQLFPDQAKVEAMVGYNKFAVSATDIVGTWEESSSSGLNYYSTVTGGYVGSSTAASANSFTLRAGGKYESQHKGAYGMTGNLSFYDQQYSGNYTQTPWELTLTNRFKGKTDTFLCHYEAVRGGRVLCLTDKVYSGMNYRLVKVK